ncbi:hypothetical protein JCM6882_003728 [Rhodosporidiobolus microsporus]
MAVRPASTGPIPSTSTSSTPRPPAPRQSSYRSPAPPSTGLSSLTTRSSSTSRLYYREPSLAGGWTGASGAAGAAGGGAPPVSAYHAWRRDSKEHALLARRRASTDTSCSSGKENKVGRGRERKASKGKEKAVAFVVGLPSSGEEGDVEHEDDTDEPTPLNEDGLEGVFNNVFDGRWEEREPSVDEIIRAQIRQPAQAVDSLDLDSLLSNGIADYSFVLDPSLRTSSTPSPPSQTRSDPLDKAPDSPAPRSDRVVLGRGKFSEVLLVRKGGTEYALKHTPLHPHHPLIATRLLREATILAQLLPHRNLVKVFETIRTPGHFYLVEENLRSSVTLEALVSSSPGGVLPVEQVWSVLEQLASVVRSLHEPLRVCHRDIKPENILIRVQPPPPSSPPNTPPTLLLKLLDFGLATHFSASEPKLTTCCGSPAYHSPELWRSLREQAVPVRYWGPEIDIWCTGLTLLRCLAPNKYPLGVSHTSLQAISDKVVDALLSIRDPHIRQVLAGFLNMDGKKRMRAFERFCAGMDARERQKAGKGLAPGEGEREEEKEELRPREFKSTSFLPGPVVHRLQLHLDEASQTRSEGPKLEATVVPPGEEDGAFLDEAAGATAGRRRTARSTSTTRTATLDSPKLSPTTVIATGLPRAASESPEVAQSGEGSASTTEEDSSVPPTPQLSPYPPTALGLYPSSSDSLASPYSLFTPSAESLSFRHPTYPPPIELTLLNPTDEPIRRAVSYIKYSLRCSGVLYHVRDHNPPPSFVSPRSSFASPESAPPSLPPTPYIQSFPSLPTSSTDSFPFPSSSEEDESYTCYLQCVVALPATCSSTNTASSALRQALAGTSGSGSATSPSIRPRMAPRAHTLGAFGGHTRSASTPPAPQAGRKDQQKEEFVQALTFYLSIRKASSPVSSSPYPSPSPFPSFRSTSGSSTPTLPSPLAAPFLPLLSTSRRTSTSTTPSGYRRRSRAPSAASTSSSRRASSSAARAYSSRIVVTLSDDRALPFVRDALSLRDGEGIDSSTNSAGDEGESSSSSAGGGGLRRGRSRFNGATSPRRGMDNSGSRDARARRDERVAKIERKEEENATAATRKKGRSKSVDVREFGSTRVGTGAASGLRMEMGPVAEGSGADEHGGGGGAGLPRRERTTSLWDFAALLGRVVSGVGGGGGSGGSGESGSTTPTTAEDEPAKKHRRRVKSTVEAAASVF